MFEEIIAKDIANRKSIAKIVLSLMEEDEKCRINDKYLYSRTVEKLASIKNLPLDDDINAVIRVFKQSSNPALLNYETVIRSRQKIQELYPLLRNKEKELIRQAKEEADRQLYYYDNLFKADWFRLWF